MSEDTGEIRLGGERFGEDLPDLCPPGDAQTVALKDVFRLVPVKTPDQACFASHFALGKVKPEGYNASDCEWASCSLYSSVEAMLKIKGLRHRNKFIAKLEIPQDSGRHVTGQNHHIHFWRYEAFDLCSAVVGVWEHGRQ